MEKHEKSHQSEPRLSPGMSLYFVGICGAGMAPLAALAHDLGYRISGEDRKRGDMPPEHAARGIEVRRDFCGFCGEVDALIYSAAVAPSHPARDAAARLGIPALSRAALLGRIMQEYPTRITVAGTHGKSTVTAMTDHILRACGKAPTTVSGASLGGGFAYAAGNREIFLCEACEYADSFLSLAPSVALALNLEHDHPDYFASPEVIKQSFFAYLDRAETAVVLPDCDPHLSAYDAGSRRKLLFSLSPGAGLFPAELALTPEGSRFSLVNEGKRLSGRFALPLLGLHSIANALAAALAAHAVGIDIGQAMSALGDFVPPRRRLEYKGERGGILYYDDYAHHPSELSASISALRAHGGGRIIAAFEPHTYSRVAAFAPGFAKALSMADEAVLLPIFAAREAPMEGVSLALIAEQIEKPCSISCSFSEAAAEIKKIARPHDRVLVMGAGDAGKLLAEFLL